MRLLPSQFAGGIHTSFRGFKKSHSALVFGIVLSYLWLIHWFWLRGVLSEDDKPIVDTKIAGTLEISASQTSNGPGK